MAFDFIPVTPSVEQLSHIILSVTGPAFLLGSLAGYTSILMVRMNRIIDRSQALHAIPGEDPEKSYLKADIPRLKRRTALLNRATFFATLSAIVTAILIIDAFVLAFFRVRHEFGVALLFIAALGLLIVSLIDLARETRIALHEYDHHA